MVSIIGEAGEDFLGVKATEIFAMKDDLEQIKSLITTQLFKPMSLTVRAKLDMNSYSADPADGPQFKYTVVRAN